MTVLPTVSRARRAWCASARCDRAPTSEIEKIFRDEAGRALATLIRLVGDFDLAEDVLQEAFAAALERWPSAEPPANPRAWLVNVGRNKAIDRIRRQIAFRGKLGELTHELLQNASVADEAADAGALDDDMLRLIFTCCHPSFAPEVQVALDVAHGVRALDRAGRARVSRQRRGDGTAAGARQAEDTPRRHRL